MIKLKTLKQYLSGALLICFFSCAAANARPYSTLASPVANAPDVVEFFSFYCGPCFQFIEQYPVVEKINRTLPEGQTVTKYHVSGMGKLGHELSVAWAVATVMGITDRIERPLFLAIQQYRSLHDTDDIVAVFRRVGVSAEQYDGARHSLIVQAFVAQQEAMARAFRVTGTPAFYIKGRYIINIGEIKADTPAQYVDAFSGLVTVLLKNDRG